ncbi:type II toxin-antitoxin system HicB family antitoxin [Campylobacter sp. JMF_01 NE2]|uniref:type II toxin-antitoxin system HicB family antitoxin n=1 Tax=unclassified Campylobacter TaxID=2593542 RepID=UPI0022EA0C23|nr:MULTISPECIES: type II toxin-antitoxin system HicB family antitoxin [unclassified Campylobacter]MDA3053192.1 type II toxin-antitoxin system HicB family antitoxin [Campylobacter sp. JMF_03 NE3]MDA3067625.1 type II toxin-antitoxin system HicB family antitoxin [Campylobacter sp. JMF_01 NE2]
MKKDLNYYLNLPYQAIVVKDTNFDDTIYYYAFYKEYKYIKGTGKNEAEAIADLKEAFKCALIEMIADNEKIIEPQAETSDKTKNYAITMKENIMQEIDEAAKKLGISRSAFLVVSAKNYIREFV